MDEQELKGADVGPLFQQVNRERVAPIPRPGLLPRNLQSQPDRRP